MLDPEQLTYVQWFWVCFAIVLAIFIICCWVDMSYQFPGMP
jgi:hypothetical protein